MTSTGPHEPVITHLLDTCEKCGERVATVDWQELVMRVSQFHLPDVEKILPRELGLLVPGGEMSEKLSLHSHLVSYQAREVTAITVSETRPRHSAPAGEYPPVTDKFTAAEVERLVAIAAEHVHGQRERADLSEPDRFLLARAWLLLHEEDLSASTAADYPTDLR